MRASWLSVCVLFVVISIVSSWESDFDIIQLHHRGSGDGGNSIRKEVIRDEVPSQYYSFVAHAYTALNPAEDFVMLPPVQGCGHGLSTPAASAAAHGGCAVATNGGFFDPTQNSTHDCLGPIVSNGKVINLDDTSSYGLGDGFVKRNVMFGIGEGEDGAPFAAVGYMNASELQARKWKQLVAGVGWLVRDGEAYLEQTQKLENWTTQRSGSGERFTMLRAPRLALGLDYSNRLVLLAVDGQEDLWDGVSLPGLAEILSDMGLRTAINLDGGGSVSVVESGTLVNVPSDDCPNVTFPRFKCQRAVASAVCLGPKQQLSTSASASMTLTATADATASLTKLMTVSVSQLPNGVLNGHGRTVKFHHVVLLILGVLVLWAAVVCAVRRRKKTPGRLALGTEDNDDDDEAGETVEMHPA